MATPADRAYVNQSRERDYVAALQQAAEEVQSLRALLTAILIDKGPHVLPQDLVDLTPEYEVTLRVEEGVYYIEAVKAEEKEDDDNGAPGERPDASGE